MTVPELFPAAGRAAAPPAGLRVPTPLEPNRAAGADLGVELWVKREDLADDLGAGHKARKLGHLLADAVERGATVVVTAASLPSGQAVGVAAHARRQGLRAHVVYCGDEQRKPAVPRGNYLLVALLGATVSWRERAPWDGWPGYLREAAEQERAAGQRPYLLVPGLSDWPGMLGSIDLGVELAGQLPGDGTPVHVVATAGSAGTCLGLAVAAHALALPWTVHGVCIGGPRDGTAAELADLRGQVERALGAGSTPTAGVRLHDGARGAGYDRPQPGELDTIRLALARYGLLLDPTYMVKTFRGLRQLVAGGEIPAGSRVVLVHSGGTFGLFGSPALDEWAAGALAPYLAGPTPAG